MIDEVDQLLADNNVPTHTINPKAAMIWSGLERQQGNHNFFLIGTLHTIEQMNEHNKRKLSGHQMIYLDELSIDKKVQLLQFTFNLQPKTQLDRACTANFFHADCAAFIQEASKKDLVRLVTLCSQILRRTDKVSDIKVVTPAIITQACKELITIHEKLNFTPQNQDSFHDLLDETFAKFVILTAYTNAGLSGKEEWLKFLSDLLLSDQQLAIVRQLQAQHDQRNPKKEKTGWF